MSLAWLHDGDSTETSDYEPYHLDYLETVKQDPTQFRRRKNNLHNTLRSPSESSSAASEGPLSDSTEDSGTPEPVRYRRKKLADGRRKGKVHGKKSILKNDKTRFHRKSESEDSDYEGVDSQSNQYSHQIPPQYFYPPNPAPYQFYPPPMMQQPPQMITIPYVTQNSDQHPTVLDVNTAEDAARVLMMLQMVSSNGSLLTREDAQKILRANRNHHQAPSGNNASRSQTKDPSIRTEEKAPKTYKHISKVRKESQPNKLQISKKENSGNTQNIEVAVNVNLENFNQITKNSKQRSHQSQTNRNQRELVSIDDDYMGDPTRFEDLQTEEPRQQKKDPSPGENESRNTEKRRGQEVARNIPKRNLKKRYSIQEYNAIKTVKELPKTLGPDWAKVEKKQKPLIRRNEYAEYVAQRNTSIITTENKLPRKQKHLSKREKGIQYAKSTRLHVKRYDDSEEDKEEDDDYYHS